MGRNKLLFDIEGEALVRRAVKNALEAQLDPVIVVLGHEAERVRQEVADLPCLTTVNADYALGVNGSLKTGVRAVPSEANAVVVILADMPFVTADMIAMLVARYRSGTTPLVISDYAGVNAPPMLYDRILFPELQTMEGEGCGRQVVKRHRSEAAVASWPEAALTDLDVPEDYERVRLLLASG
jgi:molybdenum cofactor cytidylyltransferase